LKRNLEFTVRTILLTLGAVLCLLVTPVPAIAISCSGSFSGLNLGTYTGALSTSGTMAGTVTCPRNFNYSIGLTAGLGSGATVTLRKLTGPSAATLGYQIFQNSARTTNWGNTINVDTRPGTGTGSAQTITIYPQIPANQFVRPGTYTDTITASIFNTSPLFSGPISVTAIVQAACTISATTLAFGNYTGVQSDSTATITVTCTNTTPYYINLNSGLQADSSNYPRMSGPGSDLLSYRLFQNAGRTVVWQNTVNVNGVAGTGNGTARQLTVYGRVVAGQRVRPGSYTDIVIATITY
jgi:spore coat protein U-like protein